MSIVNSHLLYGLLAFVHLVVGVFLKSEPSITVTVILISSSTYIRYYLSMCGLVISTSHHLENAYFLNGFHVFGCLEVSNLSINRLAPL